MIKRIGTIICNQAINRLQSYPGDCDQPSRLDPAASYQKSVNSRRSSQSSEHFWEDSGDQDNLYGYIVTSLYTDFSSI